MADDWEKLAGEEGEEVPSGRFGRMFKLGTMGARVGASSIASKLKNVLTPGDAEKKDEDLRKAYAKQAEHMAEVFGELKGASMKIGQLLSADPELLPPEFSDGLASLQRDAPPMTYNTVKKQVEDGLGRPIETVFAKFDPEPVGSASIGQVHRATLESGEDVAVKIQYPGVRDSLESDLKSLKSMLIYGRAFIDRERLETYFEEIKDILRKESDYVQEADNLERFGELMADREGLRTPKPYKQWCSESVLVMEYVDGEKLDHKLERMGDGPERRDLLYRWVSTYSWMFHELMELHADPHPGNFLLDDDNNLVMLDFGCVQSIDEELADGVLEVLDACWDNDMERAVETYARIGFGTEGPEDASIDHELLAQYHDIILAPFMRDEVFDFSDWKPAWEGKKFVMRHPSFLKLVPPANALLYMRVLSGIKGLLFKLDAKLNVYNMAVETAERRGVLTAF
jgi:predicted unusual protein kinase regulating ubiquinone biosynthesis (AarF/ABC1/UbiB family)